MASKFENLEEYCGSLANAEGNVRGETVRRIIETIQLDYPGATVKIAWNVPQVQIDDEYVVGLSAAKGWLTLASWSPDALPEFAPRMTDYVVNKRTFQVPVDWTPDRELLRDIIAHRLAELGKD